MKWSSAVSDEQDLQTALENCIAHAKEELGDDKADLAVVFVSQHFAAEFERVPSIIREHLGSTLVFGCSAGGVIGGAREVEHRPAVSLTGIKNKPEYYTLETRRFLKKHAITQYTWNTHFPVNTLQLMRGAVFAQRQDYYARYVEAVYQHMWAEPKKMDDPGVVRAALVSSDLPADEIMAGIQQPEIKQQLIQNTEDSVARGVFGSPSFFVGAELFFGKDKLVEVEEEIEAQTAGE